jgi:hypothetical protein
MARNDALFGSFDNTVFTDSFSMLSAFFKRPSILLSSQKIKISRGLPLRTIEIGSFYFG